MGLTPFHLQGLRAAFLPPIPGLSDFPETNLRTYVRGAAGPGIWFFSLDAASAGAVMGARLTYGLPYHWATMQVQADGTRVQYRSFRKHAETAITVEDAGPLARPDPLVLFPGASFAASLEARLADDAVMFLCDAFTTHDPRAEGRRFDQLSSDVVIRNSSGRLVVRDSFRLGGDALCSQTSPMGRWQVMASYLVLAPPARLPSQADLQCSQVEGRSIIGVSALPNAAGWGIRCLAADAIAARKATDRLFSLCCQAAFGHSPMPRRK